MVSVHDQHGVLPHVVPVHQIKDLAQVCVAHGEQGGVLVPAVLHLLRCLPHGMVARPVEERAAVLVRVKILIFLSGEEGLVRVVLIDLEHPVVLLPVLLQELYAVSEGDGDRMVLLGLHVLAVDVLLPSAVVLPAVQGLGDIEADPAFPGIAFLAPGDVIGVVFVEVVGPAFLPVVPVVCHQVGVNAVFPEDPGHGVVIVLQRSPGAVKEVVSPCVKLPARRHAGKGSGIELVECDGVPAEALEVRCLGPVTAIGLKKVTVQGIKKDHYCFHSCLR